MSPNEQNGTWLWVAGIVYHFVSHTLKFELLIILTEDYYINCFSEEKHCFERILRSFSRSRL